MNDPQTPLNDRVAALEQAVADLRAELATRSTARPPDHASETRMIHGKVPVRRPLPGPAKPRRSVPSISLPEDPEALLKWAGIGLVLLAVAFLFKYAVDEGWLTPAIRIVLGGALGLVLIALGGFVYGKRARFGQVLQGGGIAAFFITLYAGYQLLHVLDYQSSFIGMVIVTLAGFGLGLYQKDPPLVVLGLLGGLATPFLLYTGQSDVTGLMSYVCLLLAATTVIYLNNGWRSVLYTTVIGGWLVFGIAGADLPFDISIQAGDRIAIQLAIAFGVLAFWCAPLVREMLQARKPPAVAEPTTRSSLAATLEGLFRNVVHQLIVTTPLIAIAMSAELWHLEKTEVGIIAGGAALLYAIVALALRPDVLERIRYTHAIMSGLLVTLAVVMLVDGNPLLVALAAEVAVLHALATKLDDKLIRSGGHSLFVILVLWMWIRLAEYNGLTPPVINLRALTDLVVLALVVPAAFSLAVDRHQRIYFALGYAGSLAWLYRELSMLPNGHAYVTAAWGVIGVALLIVGLRSQKQVLRGAGLATLVLVVGKLFVVDLAELDPLWRVAVFLGIGAGFLAVGYFLPNLWKPLLNREEPASAPSVIPTEPDGGG